MTEPEPTRARILEAAKEEFAAVGFAGARVDAIAKKAECNKQLIYHYFGDKTGLYEAVMTDVLSDRPPIMVNSRSDVAEHIGKVFDHIGKKRLWRRLMMWESLTWEDRPVVAEEQRRAHTERACGEFERLRERGLIDPDIPPRFLMLAFMSMMSMPWLLPQMARLVTGYSPSDPEFKRQYAAVVSMIVRRMGAGPTTE